MEVKLRNRERLQGRPLLFDVINYRGKVVAQIEVDCDIKDLEKAQEQAFAVACQMHLRRLRRLSRFNIIRKRVLKSLASMKKRR